MTPLQLFTSGILLNEHESVPVTVDPTQLITSQEKLSFQNDITSVPSITQPILTRWCKAFYKHLLNQLIRRTLDMIQGLVHERY